MNLVILNICRIIDFLILYIMLIIGNSKVNLYLIIYFYNTLYYCSKIFILSFVILIEFTFSGALKFQVKNHVNVYIKIDNVI